MDFEALRIACAEGVVDGPTAAGLLGAKRMGKKLRSALEANGFVVTKKGARQMVTVATTPEAVVEAVLGEEPGTEPEAETVAEVSTATPGTAELPFETPATCETCGALLPQEPDGWGMVGSEWYCANCIGVATIPIVKGNGVPLPVLVAAVRDCADSVRQALERLAIAMGEA